jgi:hypothetical protein
MEQLQFDRLDSYYLIREVFLSKLTFLNTLQNFTANHTIFNNGVDQIVLSNQPRMFSTSGITTSKTQVRLTVCNLALDVLSKLQAFAKFANNNLLQKEVDISDSVITRANDHDFRNYIQGIYDRAQANLAALAVYGISAATQTTFLAAINAYIAAIPKVKVGQMNSKQNTNTLKSNFKTTEGALKNIDIIMKTIRFSQPALYKSYKEARKVTSHSNKKSQVEGLITDNNGVPIKYALLRFEKVVTEVNIVQATKPTRAITRKTNEQGTLVIKSLSEGIFNITISKIGYVSQMITATIAIGEPIKINVSLMPASM